MYRIGIIGAGDYGIQHANALKDIGNVELVAASRTNATALKEFTDTYQIEGYTNYKDLLDNPDIDVVVIATPHQHHVEITEAAARAQKHILLEKPMATTLQECERILFSTRHAKVQLMVGHVNRFAHPYRVAKQLIESGEIGELVMGTATMQKFWFEPNRRDWHLSRATGGGVWLTVGIHPLDRLTWLMNSAIISVSAQFGTRFHNQRADDAGMAFLRYANGNSGTIVSVGYANGAPKHTTELVGTKGMMNIDYVDGVKIGKDEQWLTVPESVPTGSWMHQALVDEWRAFIHALDTNTEPPVSAEVAHHIMKAAFAAEISSEQHREVRLNELDV